MMGMPPGLMGPGPRMPGMPPTLGQRPFSPMSAPGKK